MAELKMNFTKMAYGFEKIAKERGMFVGWWIPLSKRPPEDTGYYLTTTIYGEVYCDYWDGVCFNRTEEVIAWMPKPEPYKAEERTYPDMRVTTKEAAEAIQKLFTDPGISQEDIESSDLPFYDPDMRRSRIPRSSIKEYAEILPQYEGEWVAEKEKSMTNGDVIKRAFPNAEIKRGIYGIGNIPMVWLCLYTNAEMYEAAFVEEWWNAPYKEREDE